MPTTSIWKLKARENVCVINTKASNLSKSTYGPQHQAGAAGSLLGHRELLYTQKGVLK